MIKGFYAFLFFFLIGICGNVFSQDKEYQHIKVKHSHVFFAKDTVIKVKEDTIIKLPKGEDYLIERDDSLKTERFYDKLKSKAYNNGWSKLAYDILTTERDTTKQDASQHTEDFLAYDGIEIDTIIFKSVPVWSGSVIDTTKNSGNWFTEFSNSTHVGSREKTLRNNMILNKGDIAYAYTLADNERIIRQLPYIEDARIYVKKKKNGKLELIVVTKDLYSYGARLDMHDFDAYDYRLFDRNFLGYGTTFSNAFVTKGTGSPQYGYEGFLAQNNIRGSFVNFEATYRYAYDKIYTALLIDKQFISPSIPNGGGLKTSYLDSEDTLYRGTDSLTYVPFRRGDNYLWYGHAFKLGERKKHRNNLTLLTSLSEKNLFERPEVSISENVLYHEEIAFISSAVFSRRKYVKDQKILRFGITEDIPVGYQFGVDAGHVWGEFFDYNYLGAQGKFSVVNKQKANLTIDMKTGFSRRSDGSLQDKVLKVNTSYFSSLHKLGKFQYRSFIKASYHTATKIVENTRTVIGDNYGVRGLNYIDTEGNQRILFNYDQVFFTPWYLIGFNFAPYLFADVAYITGRDVSEPFSGYGIGFRLRNESLVIRTFHIRLGFHPQVSNLEHNRFSFTFTLDDAPRFLDIRPNRPTRVSMNYY